MPTFAYVGSFTTAERKARGDGIHVYRVEPSGEWVHSLHVGDLTNPSFLAASADQRYLYSVHGDCDYATAFRLDAETGHVDFLNRAATGGRNGVRQAIDPAGRFMVAANYASGTAAALEIAGDGSLKDQHQLVPLRGENGPHPVEQTGSHPHDVIFDPSGKFVLLPDKGLDRVFVFRFDGEGGLLAPAETSSAIARPGAGPRHLAFHPAQPVVWVLNELDSTVTVYRWDEKRGALQPLQTISALPENFAGTSTAAEIAVSRDARFVYCSNRGHDSIAIYAAAEDGRLTTAGWQSTQGKGPRFITFDPAGRFLYAANENSDSIVQFLVNAETGALTPTGQVIRTGSPVSIVFTVT